jgi:hypothetical protein
MRLFYCHLRLLRVCHKFSWKSIDSEGFDVLKVYFWKEDHETLRSFLCSLAVESLNFSQRGNEDAVKNQLTTVRLPDGQTNRQSHIVSDHSIRRHSDFFTNWSINIT